MSLPVPPYKPEKPQTLRLFGFRSFRIKTGSVASDLFQLREIIEQPRFQLPLLAKAGSLSFIVAPVLVSFQEYLHPPAPFEGGLTATAIHQV
ncbi:hypothetical protein OB13_14825 [Pontibacter sp. HJ8]